MPLVLVSVLPTIISILLQQVYGGSGGNATDSVLYYTRPEDGWVKFNDTYVTYSIVKAGEECPGHGYLLVELMISNNKLKIFRTRERTLTGFNSPSWNINVTSDCVAHGIHIARLKIIFDNSTFNGISKNLNEANVSFITVKFIYYDYITDDNYPSLPANIHIGNTSSQLNQHNEVGSSPLCTISTTKPGGDSTERDINPGSSLSRDSFSGTNSSLNLHTTKFHVHLLFSLLITLLYYVASS